MAATSSGRARLFVALSVLSAFLFSPAGVGAQTAPSARPGAQATSAKHAPIAGITFPLPKHGSSMTVHVPATPLSSGSTPVTIQHGEAGFTCVICGPMSYRGGTVMSSATIYTIFWGTFPNGYVSTIQQFFADIVADSGKTSNFYSVATQYFNATPGAINYSVSYDPVANSVIDTSAPTGTCAAYTFASMNINIAQGNCLYASEIEQKIDTVISQPANWTGSPPTTGPNSIFFLFTPDGIGSQFGDPSNPGNGKAYSDYCGFHSTTTGGNIYANQPFAAENGPSSTCEALFNDVEIGPNTINGAPNPADATISVVAHELMEAVTDSFFGTGSFAWTDAHLGTGEIGDKCSFDFGRDPTGPTDANQTINGHPYWVQDMYSNEHARCASSLQDAFAANISIGGTGLPTSTSGVTADIGTALTNTGLTPASDTATAVKLTKVAGPLTGPSQVDVAVHSAGWDSKLIGGYYFGPKITGATISSATSTMTITGSGFVTHGVTVQLQDSLTGTGGCTTSALPATSSTATTVKIAAPASPSGGSSECDIIVNSNGYTTKLSSLMPQKGQRSFHFGPHITAAKASGGFITISGTGFNTSNVLVDLYPVGTANTGGTPLANGTGLTPVGTPTATSIKVAEPSPAPSIGPSEYDVVVRSAGLTTALLGGWAASTFAFGPHVVSARAVNGVITIKGSGFSTTLGSNQVTLTDSATHSNIIPVTLTSATATTLQGTPASTPQSGSSEYDVDVNVAGLDSKMFSQNPKPGQTGFAFGPHVTSAR